MSQQQPLTKAKAMNLIRFESDCEYYVVYDYSSNGKAVRHVALSVYGDRFAGQALSHTSWIRESFFCGVLRCE